MLKVQCPKCRRGEKSELIEVLSDRRYQLRCSNCGFTYILAGSPDKEEERCLDREPTTAFSNGL